MMTLSERAASRIEPQQMRIDPGNRDHARELWRLKSLEWSKAKDHAERMKAGKDLLLDQMVIELMEETPGMSATKAERMARVSEQFQGWIEHMHDAIRVAQDLKIEAESLDRAYWSLVTGEANERAEKRLSR